MRFGKLKLLSSARKSVSITVNTTKSQHVKLLLGQEGEAFFFREAQPGEMTEDIDDIEDGCEE